MKKYQAYLIDLDGTIYAGSKRYPKAKAFVERLQAAHVPFKFVTNNTTKLPVDVVANLADNHDIHVTTDNVYTAGLATADFLDRRAGQTGKRTVYVVGEIGLKQALAAKGFTVDEDHPEYVVVGLDSDVTYEKFAKAILAIRSGSALWDQFGFQHSQGPGLDARCRGAGRHGALRHATGPDFCG